MNVTLFITLTIWIVVAGVGLLFCGRMLDTAHDDVRRVRASKRTDLLKARMVIARARITQERIAVVIQVCYLYTGLAIVLSTSGTAWRWTWPLALIIASILQVVSSWLRRQSRVEALRVLDEELAANMPADLAAHERGRVDREKE